MRIKLKQATIERALELLGYRKWSVHEWYCRSHILMSGIYEYNPADDGPEVEAITRILAGHPYLESEAA